MFRSAIASLGVILLGCTAAAETFPDRTITIIVPFAPGGPVDSGARVLADGLGKELGQSVIVENRPGAQGVVGLTAAATSPADGYRILYAAGSVLNSSLVPALPFELTDRMDPIGSVSIASYCFYVGSQVPVSTLKEFIDYAKANPGKLNYGAQALSTSLILELLKKKASIEVTSIPYNGSAPAIAALLAGDVQAIVDNPGSGATRSNTEAGKLKVLACTDKEKNPYLPNAPTFTQSGYPDIVATITTGVWGPKGIDRKRRAILEAAIFKVISNPDAAQKFFAAAAPAKPELAGDLLKSTRTEGDFWVNASKTTNFKFGQ